MSVLFVYGIFLCWVKLAGASTPTCLTNFTGVSIYSNDLANYYPHNASACCSLCQTNSGCAGWTWNNVNGGTCWLKTTAAPLYHNYAHNESITGVMSPVNSSTYSASLNLNAANFWNSSTFVWHFDVWGLTNVTTNVASSTAKSLGIIGEQDGKVYIGVDHTNVYTTGRPSVMITSNYLFNSGLFLLDLAHFPVGPGTWPSWWFSGPDWPNYGEIDVIEGVNGYWWNLMSLHNTNCVQQANVSLFMKGAIDAGSYNTEPYTAKEMACWSMTSNATVEDNGCSVSGPNSTFGPAVNTAGRGVYALQWVAQKYIRIWNFIEPNIPADIASQSNNPNPDAWGFPDAYFDISRCQINNQSMLFDIAFCGSWAAQNQWFPGGEAACEHTLLNYPGNYTNAYWLVNSVRTFCRPGEPCGFSIPQCEFSC